MGLLPLVQTACIAFCLDPKEASLVPLTAWPLKGWAHTWECLNPITVPPLKNCCCVLFSTNTLILPSMNKYLLSTRNPSPPQAELFHSNRKNSPPAHSMLRSPRILLSFIVQAASVTSSVFYQPRLFASFSLSGEV